MRKLGLILLILLIGYWLTIFVLTHIPVQKLPPSDVNDKLAHFVAYAGLASLLYLTMWTRWPAFRYPWLYTIAIALVYGAIDEVLQIPVNRVADVNDWLADAAGAILAASVWAGVRWFSWRQTIARQKDAWKVRDEVRDHVASHPIPASGGSPS